MDSWWRVRVGWVLVLAGSWAFAVQGVPLAGDRSSAFPTQGLLPKAEIGALRFLEAHPGYDGRGVVVAIFDTGVDPGAPGLQTTTDGKPKIVDVLDGTGGGDVDTSTVREAQERQIKGLTGRTLTVGREWRNPTGKYHLGMKAGYELFPEPLVDRLRQKRKERWDRTARGQAAELQGQLATWDAGHPNAEGEARKERKELETRLEQWRALQKAWDDPGPIFDCVVFHDGDTWRAAVDTDEDGDLDDEALLTNFRVERQYGTFGPEALLNFVLNIEEEGRRLSIVVDSGTHGTHVAGIVAAHFPEAPELNGVAPGAQLVSVKIGDTRLGGMETATGFVRGLAAVRAWQCDVINLSYGEATSRPNRGRPISLMQEIVNEDGVVFVSSAGNDGPALSTVGAPGGTTSALIGVGAYVSPDMMIAGYSLRETVAETQFTWSSRGPTSDGDWGVNVSAPGGAFAPVPTWTLQRSEHMNGTSMASPAAAGAVALVLSGLKAEGLAWSPAAIRRSLENSARTVPEVEVFAQGCGLLQVDRAFEAAQLLASASRLEPRLEVSLPQRGGARGVYLREPQETARPLVTVVSVRPVYRKAAENRIKLEFERRFRLEATAPWIEVPGHLFLVHDGRTFEIKVDPTGLPMGAHAAEVLAYEESPGDLGPVFRIPVTVIRPLAVRPEDDFSWCDRLRLGPSALERRFFAVPEGASWAELEVRAGALDAPRRLVVHALQLLPQQPYTATERKQYLTLGDHGRELVPFPVLGGRTLEVCLGQFWSSLGEGEFEFRLTFRGLEPAGRAVHLDGAAGLGRAEVRAGLRAGSLAPQAQLRTRCRVIRPSEAVLRPLPGDRDRLTEGRQLHELVLSFPIPMEEEGAVLPRFPALNGRLYDGEFESQLYMIFDAGKRLVTVDDGWEPGQTRLAKGDYVLRFHLRHDRPEWLENLKQLPLVLEQELASPLALEAYEDADEALVRGARFAERTLAPGEHATLVLAAPAADALEKAAQAGEVLRGTVRFERDEGAPQWPLTLLVPPTGPMDKTKASEEERDERSTEQKMAEAWRDFRVGQLDQLMHEKDADSFAALATELQREYPDHLPIWVKRLHRLDNDQRDRRLRSVVNAADDVLSRVNRSRLATNLVGRPDEEDPKARRMRRELEREKEALVDALHRKARALAWMELPDEAAGTEAAGAGQAKDGTSAAPEPAFDHETVERLFEAAFAELRSCVDTTEEKYLRVHIRREWRQGRLGEALRLLLKEIGSSPTDRLLHEKRIAVLKDLGWSEWVDHETTWMLRRFPKDYPAF